MSGLQGQWFQQLLAAIPQPPTKWTKRYLTEIIVRANKRIEVLEDRLNGIIQGRVMPDLEQVTIGSGKQFRLSILFLDICSFSTRSNWTLEQQKSVLVLMNIFMAEMLNVVRDFGGTYEKNTGDGLMAYFGDGETTDATRVKPAAEAAVVMHYVNDNLISPWLQKQGIAPVRFRVGIDLGPVTIARVGLRGEMNSVVAVGTPANIACKLMNLIPEGGICIGDDVYRNLPNNWTANCKRCETSSGFVYTATQMPYIAWELNHRLTPPTF
jgi:class 3 adenylate cyclase